jgi:galactokinase
MKMKDIKDTVFDLHTDRFRSTPLIVRAPGRINIIGEHTDYNGGFVLPAAVDRYVYVAISLRNDDEINLYSMNFEEQVSFDTYNLEKLKQQWANYVIGVLAELDQRLPQGFDLTIYGDVPMGAGMSSSAAFESAVGFAVDQVYNLGRTRMDLAKIGQRCEHRYIGVKCGIMDQFASLHGKEDKVVKLDCRNLDYTYFPLILGEYVILLLNTNVTHSLASSAYNDRRTSCEEAVERIQKVFPGVESLRDVSIEMLDHVIIDKDEECYNRAQYVIAEIQRVREVCVYLERGELKQAGAKMFETHEGLTWLYEVSCPELDFLVEYVRNFPNEVLGARMMGGGFGGCTINIVKESFLNELIEGVNQAYKQRFGIELDNYKVKIGNGAEIIA